VGGEHLLLDPEVEHLLREIAADPRSSLLRVSRSASLTGLLERSAPVSPNASGLTSAERHLLAVYRSELVYLLGSACLLRFYSDPGRAISLHKSVTVEQPMTVPDSVEWRSRCLAALSANKGYPDVSHILERCIADGTFRSVSIAEIAATALRIQPCDPIRIYAGFDLAQRGQWHSALNVLRAVLAGPATRLDASFAWEDIAFVHAQLDQYGEAILAAQKAAHLEPGRVEPFMNWFFNACMAGSTEEARTAAVAIDELIDDNHPALASFILQIRRQRERGDWRPTIECRKLLVQVRERLARAPRRIADVFE
jgi:tetratricopeptide (TPR) repeat protein